MLLNLFYNYLTLILIGGVILWITYYIKNICYCFKKRFLGELILFLGISMAIGIPLSVPVMVSQKFIEHSTNQMHESFANSYKIIIYPKSYPFEENVHISLKGKDTSLFLSIPNQDFDFETISRFLIQYKPKIDLIFQE